MKPAPLASGFCFGEGPRWFEGLVWFSDMLGEAVHTVTLHGEMSTLELPGHAPSGLGFRPDGTLLIAAERGLLLRSRDAGQTWEPLELDYPGSMFGALALGDGRWLAFGMRGNAFVSENDGDSWQAVDTGVGDSLFGGTQLADGRVVLVGAMHTILIATPGEWTFRRVIPSKQGTYSTVIEAPDGAVLVGGDPGAQLIDLATGERRNGGDDA